MMSYRCHFSHPVFHHQVLFATPVTEISYIFVLSQDRSLIEPRVTVDDAVVETMLPGRAVVLNWLNLIWSAVLDLLVSVNYFACSRLPTVISRHLCRSSGDCYYCGEACQMLLQPSELQYRAISNRLLLRWDKCLILCWITV